MKSLAISGVLACAALFTSCHSEPYKINEMQVDTAHFDVLGDAQEGKTGLLIWPGLIPFGYNDLLRDTVNRAIASKGGEQLVNVTINESWWWAWVIQGFHVDVQGTVIKKKAG